MKKRPSTPYFHLNSRVWYNFLKYITLLEKRLFAPKLKHLLTFEWIVQLSPNWAETLLITKSLILKSLNDLGSKVKVRDDLEIYNFNFLLECSNDTKFGIIIFNLWPKELTYYLWLWLWTQGHRTISRSNSDFLIFVTLKNRKLGQT